MQVFLRRSAQSGAICLAGFLKDSCPHKVLAGSSRWAFIRTGCGLQFESVGGGMGPLQELLAVDQRRALEFFVTGLQDVSDPGVDRQELLYNASVLAHYAQVSTHAELEMPAPANLTTVFDTFVLNTAMPLD